MKKILFTFFLLLCACNNSSGLGYGTYKMINSPDNVPVILTLAKDGKLNAKVVNIIMGQYTTSGNVITINPAGSTMMMGPQKEMDVEQNFVQSLLLVKTFKMQDDKLVLEMEDGSNMVFEPYSEPNE